MESAEQINDDILHRHEPARTFRLHRGADVQRIAMPGSIGGEAGVMQFLLDPRLFNFVIMAMYSLNALRWAIAHSWADCFYWLSALAITATVTFGYQHG